MTHKRRGTHYTKATQSASRHCSKCGKEMAHRVDRGRLGPCLDCIARLEGQAPVGLAKPRIECVPMACFCGIHAFPHYHPGDVALCHYPGPPFPHYHPAGGTQCFYPRRSQ